MDIYHHLSALLSKDIVKKNYAVTIGNFDGVHAGHQKFLNRIAKECAKKDYELVVITFHPHPRSILAPDEEHLLINSYQQKHELLDRIGVKNLIEINFTRDFSNLSPTEFLDYYIFLPGNHIKAIYLGHDFSFGANKQGDYHFIQSYLSGKDVECGLEDQYFVNQEHVSSSVVRHNIQSGLVENVTSLLGRPFFLTGVVVKGKGRGKEIGFPTANIKIADDIIIPNKGVYITKSYVRGAVFDSITNIGLNPTFENNNQLNIETHILNFDQDIYGEILQVHFLKKLRDEKKFSSANELVGQIKQDVHYAEDHLKQMSQLDLFLSAAR